MSNYHNRVLIRAGARELAPHEVRKVQANTGTDTVCTYIPPSFLDGDPGEC